MVSTTDMAILPQNVPRKIFKISDRSTNPRDAEKLLSAGVC